MENTNENGAAVARENIEIRDIGGALQITIGGEAYRRLECLARVFNRFNAKYKCWSGDDDTPLTAFGAFCVFHEFEDFAGDSGGAFSDAAAGMVEGLAVGVEWFKPGVRELPCEENEEYRRRHELNQMIESEIFHETQNRKAVQ